MNSKVPCGLQAARGSLKALNYESSLGLHFTNPGMLYDIVMLMQAASIPNVLESCAWELGLARGQLLCWRDKRWEMFQQAKAVRCMGNCQEQKSAHEYTRLSPLYIRHPEGGFEFSHVKCFCLKFGPPGPPQSW